MSGSSRRQLRRYWKSQKTGKGDALRKEQALLHTFVAGQKYGVGRDPPVLFLNGYLEFTVETSRRFGLQEFFKIGFYG